MPLLPASITALPIRFRVGVCLSALILLLFVSASSRAYSLYPPLRINRYAPHASQIQKVFDRIPLIWKSPRRVLVQEVSAIEMDRMLARNGMTRPRTSEDVDGCYHGGGVDKEEPALITLRESLRTDESEAVFVHEFGHLVWDELITREQRSRYQRLWQEQRRSRHLVTVYAGENVEEGFAEAFGHFLRKPELLRKRDARSWQFLSDLQIGKSRGTDR